jgi:prepilin-type N-terminal cleavage/methylation domain-containing protein
MVRPRAHDERGFTLIELMMVVAVVAILAAIVVPLFMSEGRKVKASSEVSAMFAELSTKQEQYKLELGKYLDVPACPATPSAFDQDITPCITSQAWLDLRIAAPESKLKCSYLVETGLAGEAVSPPAGFTLPPTAATGWYWIHAKCDMDNNPALFSEYLISSLDTQTQKVNEGK